MYIYTYILIFIYIYLCTCTYISMYPYCQYVRESLSWIRMTRTARQDARRWGKEDAGHSLFLEECLFGFHGEHKLERGLVGT